MIILARIPVIRRRSKQSRRSWVTRRRTGLEGTRRRDGERKASKLIKNGLATAHLSLDTETILVFLDMLVEQEFLDSAKVGDGHSAF